MPSASTSAAGVSTTVLSQSTASLSSKSWIVAVAMTSPSFTVSDRIIRTLSFFSSAVWLSSATKYFSIPLLISTSVGSFVSP